MLAWTRRVAPHLFVAVLVACGGDGEPLASAGPPSSQATGQSGDDPTAPTGGGSGGETGEPECGGPSPSLIPQEPSAECAPDVPCVSDANCPAGHVCNTALDPPECTLLYCGGAGTPCHDESVCAQGLKCHEGLCNPCTFCGDLCEVDFSTDPAHCGCCDHPVPKDRVCVDGAFDCLPEFTRCGDACVDLASDSLHCGSCDNPVEPGFVCEGGGPACADSSLLCDGECIDPASDEENCGNCGATCPYGRCIGGGLCLLEVGDPQVIPLSCAAMCEAAGLVCYAGSEVGTAYYVGPCDALETPIPTCDTVPAEKDTAAGHLCGIDCTCGLGGQACRCHPIWP